MILPPKVVERLGVGGIIQRDFKRLADLLDGEEIQALGVADRDVLCEQQVDRNVLEVLPKVKIEMLGEGMEVFGFRGDLMPQQQFLELSHVVAGGEQLLVQCLKLFRGNRLPGLKHLNDRVVVGHQVMLQQKGTQAALALGTLVVIWYAPICI